MPYREFFDPAGTEWRVWDTRPSSSANVRPSFAAGWLTFQSATERRRLSPIPDRWELVSEPAICLFLERAVRMTVVESTAAGRDVNSTGGAVGSIQLEVQPAGLSEPQTTLLPLVEKLAGDSRSAVERAREVLSAVTQTLAGPGQTGNRNEPG